MTLTNTIHPDWFLPSLQQAVREPKHVLGKNDFLKLLLVELQNQDPLSPINEKEMIAQLTQFTTLEQLIEIGDSLQSIAGIARENQLLQYSNFIGKTVSWEKYDPATEEVDGGSGKIVSIEFSESSPLFTLEDGTALSVDHIVEIRATTKGAEHPLAQASRLIGYYVEAEVDGETISGIVQSVALKDGTIEYQLQDDAVTKVCEEEIVLIATEKPFLEEG